MQKELNIKEAPIEQLKAVAFDIRNELDRYNNALNQIVSEINERIRAEQVKEKANAAAKKD